MSTPTRTRRHPLLVKSANYRRRAQRARAANLPQVAKNYDTIAEYWHAQYLDKIKKKSRARYEKARDAAGFTPQTGRMLKLVCPECHRIIRLSHKSLEAGEIVCFPCNRSFSPAEG